MICLTAFTINYSLPKIKGNFKLISGLCIWGLFLLDFFFFFTENLFAYLKQFVR